MNIPYTNLPRLVIIGGGFAGVALARKMVKEDVQLVLLDRHNYHTFQPLLYQVSTSSLEPDSIAYPLRKIVKRGKNTFFRMTEVSSIDPNEKKVHTNIGSITYDYLVIATGARTNFFGNETIEKNAMRMKNLPQALNLRSLLLENLEQAVITTDPEKRKELLRFVLAGAGPTGVELAGGIAELQLNVLPRDYPDMDFSEMEIHLIEGADRVLPPMSTNASEKASKFLTKMGVRIHTNTQVTNYESNLVSTNTDLSLKTATFIWSAGVTGAPVEGLQADTLIPRANRYKVNEYNQIEGYNDVYAIGDIALMQTDEYPKGHPMVAQPAIQQGNHLVKNLKRQLKGMPMIPFKYFDKGSMATIGRNKAVVDLGKFRFGGFFAWFVWMFIHLWFLVGFRNRFVTFFNWTYNYINYDKAARLIVRPFKNKKENEVERV
ncbi:NAD(P)/FAD-dependent oxidoreductase [Aquimarina sp. MMG015]|uniref:NAD(P)/FAD-dependent oxidoreductase n=1 Tax=unclassified Aquimarina TaxID=2627091 RepID=UPI000E53EB39|nr:MULTISPECIES: NAD(P)/FAD-dependent oxidoreductase [unclassified Aquimarina]AXT54239.1 NAD(P)/FAD-dependent oxidoreductase [Aquimarina sp. AD1]MBQ4804228.1 NAD(P)/FAD-dependent oxidoreductase [Aquimarina sp. MMG015]RKN28493.1 NAD(P)/FAD-dependent oxidoreductase [Aquimarina sp. AD1]